MLSSLPINPIPLTGIRIPPPDLALNFVELPMTDPVASTANPTSLAAEAPPTTTRYVLGVNRVLIEGNDSKWAGEKEDPLGMLLDRLKRYALDPRFEDYGGFASM